MSELFTLKNEYLTVEVSSHGAELQSIKDKKGQEYLWQGNKEYWGRRACFLFPIVGSLNHKETIINGQTYHMNQHGFLRDQEFELLNQTDNEISLVNYYNEETLALYPFKYKIIITYSFKGAFLSVNTTICNESNNIIPFNFGAHPGFICPMSEGEGFSDYYVRFEHHETFNSPAVAEGGLLDFSQANYSGTWMRKLPLTKELFDIDTVTIPRPRSRSVQLLSNKSGKGIELRFPGFNSFAIWSPRAEEAHFVCLEPWVGYADKVGHDGQFIHKDSIVMLGSLQERNFEYLIRIIDK